MSASTVSITANPAAARRRPVVAGEKKSGLDLVATDASPLSGGEIGVAKDSSHSIERSRRDAVVVQVKRPIAPNSTTETKPRSSARKGGASSGKPRWQTVASVFTKNLLLLVLLAGFVQMIRRLYSTNTPVSSDNFDGRIAEVEAFVKKTTKMMQVQVEVVDRKIQKMEDKASEMESELGKLGTRTGSVEKYLSGKEWLSKGEFDKFVEDYNKAKGGNDGDVNLDEVRAFARGIVEKEIEKHAADGLGRVDYALASGGAAVVKHSEPYIGGSRGGGWFYGTNRNGVHSNAEKILRPSFGEPGECFPLKGSSGFVQIKLRTAIIPEAITLEHVAKVIVSIYSILSVLVI